MAAFPEFSIFSEGSRVYQKHLLLVLQLSHLCAFISMIIGNLFAMSTVYHIPVACLHKVMRELPPPHSALMGGGNFFA